ncbi:MAG: restriction endonuclease subunit S, partial [Chloroflexota bacterium]|nr:restriction endonuclease subunit S [Chloroflexota bacterium]
MAEIYENVGEHWEEKKLGDIASEMQTGPFGSTLHKSDYVANGIPVINPQNLVDGEIIPLQ